MIFNTQKSLPRWYIIIGQAQGDKTELQSCKKKTNKQTRNLLFHHNWPQLSGPLLNVIPSETDNISELWSQLTRQIGSQSMRYTPQMSTSTSPLQPRLLKQALSTLLSILIHNRNVSALSGFSVSIKNCHVYICQLNSGISQYFPWVDNCRLYQMLSWSLCKHDPQAFNLRDSSSIPLPVV